MTNHPIAEQDSLEARLRSLRSEQVYINRDGTIRPDYRNPDGPEAADTLSQMRAAGDEMADKLWILRCDSRDAPAREVAERAIEMWSAALTTTKIEKDRADG